MPPNNTLFRSVTLGGLSLQLLEQGLGFQPETEVGIVQILATRPVISDKESAKWKALALQDRASPKKESSEASKVSIRRERSTVRVDRPWGRESRWVATLWLFEWLWWGIFSMFPLANHFDLPGSQVLFGVSQDLPLCAHASLSQDGFYQKGIWKYHPLSLLPVWPARNIFWACVVWEVSWFQNEKRCGLGRAQPPRLNCPAILVLEFLSIGNESPVTLPWEGPSASCLRTSAIRLQRSAARVDERGY